MWVCTENISRSMKKGYPEQDINGQQGADTSSDLDKSRPCRKGEV